MEAAATARVVGRRPPASRFVSDERLAAGVRAADQRSFEAIYDRYHRPLLGFCRHMLGSREESEDALQQVFASAYRGLLAENGPVRLKPWLYAIARNRCLSMLQARCETVALDDAHEPSTDGLAIESEIERRQELKDLLGDLVRLPEAQRAALVLAEIGDLSHDEIGVAMGVRREKVRALVFQARESLIGSRRAREASCHDIQEQLATLRGGALRRTDLHRHVAACAECAAFKVEVKRQRTALAALMPVLPGLALKHSVLTSALAAGNGVAAGGVAATVTAGSAGLAAKLLAVVVVVGGASAGGIVVAEHHDRRVPAPPALSQPKPSAVVPELASSANTENILRVGAGAGHKGAAGRGTKHVKKHHARHGASRRRQHGHGPPATHTKATKHAKASRTKRDRGKPSSQGRRVLGAPPRAKRARPKPHPKPTKKDTTSRY
jgi:RNA polymerase sigma factor (sigma-70 family)